MTLTSQACTTDCSFQHVISSLGEMRNMGGNSLSENSQAATDTLCHQSLNGKYKRLAETSQKETSQSLLFSLPVSIKNTPWRVNLSNQQASLKSAAAHSHAPFIPFNDQTQEIPAKNKSIVGLLCVCVFSSLFPQETSVGKHS